jgi:hypothetical protein
LAENKEIRQEKSEGKMMRRKITTRAELLKHLSRRLRASAETTLEAERQRVFLALAGDCERRVAERGDLAAGKIPDSRGD